MKLLITSPAKSSLTGNGSSVNGYVLVAEGQTVVGLVNVLLASPPSAFYTLTIHIANRSVGGQDIRVGFNPAFAPAAGILLTPGDTVELNNLSFGITAVANIAGALVDVFAIAQLIS